MGDFWCIYRYLIPGWTGWIFECFFQGLDRESVLQLSWYPSRIGVDIWPTSPVDSWTYNGYMDKPSWCPTNWETLQQFYRWNGFVTTPVPFNINFPKNRDFEWSRWEYDRYSRFEGFRRSRAMSRCGQMSETWSEVIWIKFYVENSFVGLVLGY